MQNIDILHYILICALMPFTILVNRTLYQKVKSEEHREKGKIVQQIIKIFSIVQCLCMPTLFLLNVLLKLSLDYFKVITLPSARYIITSLTFFTSFTRDYIGFHSLITSITRYTFIAFDSSAEKFGIQKLRRIFITLSFIIPLLSAIIYDATTPLESSGTTFEVFYGEKVSSNGTNKISDTNLDYINLNIQSPMYYLTNTFFPASIVYSMKVIGVILFILIYANVIEAFLYGHMMMIYKRY